MNKHTKILAWGDYCCYTGFANVMSNIFCRLINDVHLDVIGINYDGRPDYDHNRFPGRVWPAQSMSRHYFDAYGVEKLLDRLTNGSYDTLFILNDPFVVDKVMSRILSIRAQTKKEFKIVYYYPLDTYPLTSWIRESVALADYPVAYTSFAYRASVHLVPELDGKLLSIPHGIDFHDYYYRFSGDKQVYGWRRKLTRDHPEKYLLVNVNRNTPRKDIHRSLMVLSELKTMGVDVMLYLHCSPQDLGGDFTIIAQWLGLQEGIDYTYPHDLTPSKPYSINAMNCIYNAADAVITTSLGEGWGFSLTEAMATKTPVVAPCHTSINEIIDDERGFGVKTGDTSSLWRVIENDNMVLRPLTNVEDMASVIRFMIFRPGETQRIAENGYSWVRNLGWDQIVERQWKPLLLKDGRGNNSLH